eukprot:251030-Ditylum_brightwellii.AAC.1
MEGIYKVKSEKDVHEYDHIQEQQRDKHLNKALEVVVLEIDNSDPEYSANLVTTVETAKFGVQLKPGKSYITVSNSVIESKALSMYAQRSHTGVL